MEYLRALYGRSCAGRSQTVLISGAVASGKTNLLCAFIEEAVGPDGILLMATGSGAEQAIPLGVIGQLFANTTLPPDLTDVVSDALAGCPADGIPEAAGAAGNSIPVQISQTLLGVMSGICAEKPVVICVDDMQYSDTESLEILLYLLRRLRIGKLLVIFTEVAGPRPGRPIFRAELLRQPNCHRLILDLLSPEEVEGALSGLVDPAVARQLAPGYHAISGGNPLLLHGLIEDGSQPRSGGGCTLSSVPVTDEHFRQAVFSCLYRWDQDIIDVARGLAVLGPWAAPQRIGQLVGFEIDVVRRCLDPLTRSGLVGSGWFRHPAMAEVVLDSLGAPERSRIHLHAAELLHERGAPAVDVARHILAAGQGLDRWSVSVLRSAAAEALADDQVGFAYECLELARGTCQDPQARAELTLELTQLEWRYRPAAAARHLTPLCDALREGVLEQRHVITLLRFLIWHGRTAEARQLLQWLAARGLLANSAMTTELQCLGLWTAGAVGLPPEDRHSSQVLAMKPRDELTHPGLSAAQAMASTLRDGPNDQAVGLAERVLATSALSDETVWTVRCAVQALTLSGQLGPADRWCREFLQQARGRHAASWEAMLIALQARVVLRRGDLRSAEQRAGIALAILPLQDWGTFVGHPLSVLLLAQAGLGKYEEAAATARRAVPEAMLETWTAVDYLYARGQYFLDTERLQAAGADFRRCGDLMRRANMDYPALAPWRSGAAEVELRLGSPTVAEALIRQQLTLPGAHGAFVRGTSLRVLAAALPFERRPDLLRESAGLLEIAGYGGEACRSLAALRLTHQELGEEDRAAVVERRLLHAAQACGAEDLVHRLPGLNQPEAADGAGPAGGTADAVHLLSDAEQRVARLAVQGLTNRQISSRLHITVSTVEQHLTHVYRKLDVSRRASLPLWLKADDDEGDRGDGPARIANMASGTNVTCTLS